MSQQAIVTLVAITPGIVPSKRVLKLNPDRLSVPIGRASKSISKGLVGAEDNAWFDNPVMSRDHAELVFDPDDVAILIKDTRSMHGTMLNDQKVPIDSLQQVTTGDTLSFGTEVRRGPDTFPPCRFKITHEFVTWTSVEDPLANLQDSTDIRAVGHGFQFPDSSDIEDDQDLFEEEGIMQEGDVTPAESLMPKTSTAADAIDLPKDETVPPDAITQGSAAEKQASPGETVLPVSQARGGPSTGQIEYPINLDDDSSSEDEIDESEQQDEEESDADSDEDSDKENYDESSDEAEDAVGESIYDSESSDAMPAEDSQTVSMGFDSHNDPHHVQTHMFYDNKDIPISSMRSTVAKFSDANTRVDALDQRNYQGATGADMWPESFSNRHSEHELPLMPAPAAIALNSDQPGAAGGVHTSVSRQRVCMTPEPLIGSKLGLNDQTQPIPRQPSPSDAAMAKSFKNGSSLAPQPNFRSIDDMIPAYARDYLRNKAKAQSLGDRIGKHEFFQAREINRVRAHEEEPRFGERRVVPDEGNEGTKAKLSQLIHPFNTKLTAPIIGNSLCSQPPSSYFSSDEPLGPPTVPHQQTTRQMIYQQSVAPNQMPFSHHMHREQLPSHHMHREQLPSYDMPRDLFIQRLAARRALASSGSVGDVRPKVPTSYESRIGPDRPARPTTPEPDMTSAVKFNQSKLLIAAQRAWSQPNRSSVRIDDIVERSVVDPTIESLKRKISDISGLWDEECRAWAAKDPSIAVEIVKPPLEDHIVGTTAPNTRDDSSPNEAITSVQQTAGQPATKKLKRFAENVAYFALGGIAISAGLFSVLVNSAPDFLDA